MKSRFIAALAAAGLFSTAPAFAGLITIDFEGPTSFASIDQFYNGGTDTAGAPGPNLGVSFGLDALELKNGDGLGTGSLGEYFSNAPSPSGVLALAAAGPTSALDFAGGFTDSVSLYFASPDDASFTVWSGLDGTGTPLATLSLASNNTSTTSPYSVWTFKTFSFSGVGQSITFDGSGFAAFDNVTINAVPEPDSVALLAVGIAGLGFAVARRKQKTA